MIELDELPRICDRCGLPVDEACRHTVPLLRVLEVWLWIGAAVLASWGVVMAPVAAVATLVGSGSWGWVAAGQMMSVAALCALAAGALWLRRAR